MSDLKPVSLRLNEEDYDALFAVAGKIQAERGKQVSVNEVIRDLIHDLLHRQTEKRLPVAKKYKRIGRRILQTMDLKQGELPEIFRGASMRSHVIAKRDKIPQAVVECEELLIPTFVIGTNPTWKMFDRSVDRDDVLSRSMDSLDRQEDSRIFASLSSAVPTSHTFLEEDPGPHLLDKMLHSIEEHELDLRHLICHPGQFDMCNDWLVKVRMGQIYDSVDVISSTMCPRHSVYALADPDVVGRLIIQQDTAVLCGDRNEDLLFGYVIWRCIGVGIVNNYATAKMGRKHETSEVPEDQENVFTIEAK